MDTYYIVGRKKTVPVVLALIAAALCLIMSLHSIAGAGLAGCGAGSSCDEVLGSRWSMVLGVIPVSVLALGVYISFIICLFLIDKSDSSLRPAVWRLEFLFCGVIVGSAILFSALQWFVIGSFCKYCMSAHITGIVLAVSFAVVSKSCAVPHRAAVSAFVAGLVLAAFSGAFQTLTVKDDYYRETVFGEELPNLETAGFPVLLSGTDIPSGVQTFHLLYDYQCPHCRRLHEAAEELLAAYPGKYRFILCPTPLSNACNPFLPPGKDNFPGSCDYARLALAVWELAPSSFATMDSCLWNATSPREALEFACTLVESSRLEAYLASDALFEKMALSMELFGRTTSGEKSGLPRIVGGQRCVIPEVSDSQGLLKILEQF